MPVPFRFFTRPQAADTKPHPPRRVPAIVLVARTRALQLETSIMSEYAVGEFEMQYIAGVFGAYDVCPDEDADFRR